MEVSDFKIGDRVIHINNGDRGVIVKSEWETMIAVRFETPDKEYFSSSSHHNPKFFELDKQYYREERLKQILNGSRNKD